MVALQQSSVQFKSAGDEASYLVSHIARAFQGGFSGSGENGIDVSLPLDTPVYALEGGTVKGSGYYPGGGVVSIQSAPGKTWYYQHLDQDSVGVGQSVQAGQLIGYSGGQNTGGNHPADPTYSSWPHIEVGINAPWAGIWGGGNGAANIDPVPAITAIEGSNASTSGASTSIGGIVNPLDPSTWLSGIQSGFFNQLGITSLQDFFWRAGFILAGFMLMAIGYYAMIVPGEVRDVENIAIPAAKAAS
jgi:murein DD-endopeptidase MepM/ murein hydrolase activator NlpD